MELGPKEGCKSLKLLSRNAALWGFGSRVGTAGGWGEAVGVGLLVSEIPPTGCGGARRDRRGLESDTSH